MKLLSTSAFALIGTLASAQCDFTPTIEPNNPVACPVGFLTLSTQTYTTYQWYENSQPIVGQTSQFLQVDASSMGNSFTVQCMQDLCTEMSAPVVLDGYIFLLPSVINGGDEPNGFGLEGEQLFCEGDTAYLILGLPYDTNIQWTNGGTPIPGANEDTLMVITNGDWSASGAPAVCPEFIESVGVTITTMFSPPSQPDIVVFGDTLCPYPTGNGTQWYLNGAPVATAGDCIGATAAGSYVVVVDYGNGCSIPSEPHIVSSLSVQEGTLTWSIAPDPANEYVTLQGPAGATISDWSILDLTGRVVLRADQRTTLPLTVRTGSFTEGRYFFTSPGMRPMPLTVVH